MITISSVHGIVGSSFCTFNVEGFFQSGLGKAQRVDRTSTLFYIRMALLSLKFLRYREHLR